MPSLRRCPWSQIDDEATNHYQAWIEWRTLHTSPWGPDIMAAPCWYVELIQWCEHLVGEAKRAQEKQQLADLERQKRQLAKKR